LGAHGIAPQAGNANQAERTRRTDHRGTDEILEEAVEHLVTYHEWFEGKVKDSLAAVERGQTVTDAAVRAWLEKRERA
jgi:predicted transcriptional regulator